MTLTPSPRPMLSGLHSGLRSGLAAARPVERAAYLTGALLCVSGLVHLVVLLASGGDWTGPLSIRKAVTFGLSFGFTVASVAWAASFLRLRERNRTLLVGVFTATGVLETVLVSLQVWRGVPSHFNFATGFDTLVSMSLALGGLLIVLTVLGLCAAALRTLTDRTASPLLVLAVRAGLLFLVLALVVGALMIAKGSVLARGGQPELAYTTAGSLKPVHAVPMHAVLVLPALAWLLSHSGWTRRRSLAVLWAAIAAYGLLTLVVGLESFTGVSPLAAPWLPTLASALALLVLGAAGVLALLRALGGRVRG